MIQSSINNKNINYSYTSFIIIWIGQLISSIGSGLTAFALGIYVYQRTGLASSYSLMLLAAFMPPLLLKPIGGTLSDRINRKLLMIIGDFGSAAGLLLIVTMMYLGIKDLWVIYLGTVISSIFVAFQNPAYKASVTDLIEEKFYSKASGLMQLAESSKFLISPIIAGFLLKMFDIKEVLIIDIFTFLIAIFTIFWVKQNHSVKSKKIEHQSFIKELAEGFNYLLLKKEIFLLISIISFVTFFIGLLQALLGPMILSFTSPQSFGIFQTISTTGMLIGSCFIGLFGKSNKKIPILSFSLILNGIFFSLLGTSENIIMITFSGFLFFLVLPFVNTSLDVLVRSNVRNDIQGRIWSIVSLISQLGMGIAFAIGGYLADHVFSFLQATGMLTTAIGILITAPGKGIGLIIMLSGLFVTGIAIIIGRLKILKRLDDSDKCLVN